MMFLAGERIPSHCFVKDQSKNKKAALKNAAFLFVGLEQLLATAAHSAHAHQA